MPAFQIQVQGLLDGATPFVVPATIPAPQQGGVIKIDAGVGIDVGTFNLAALARTTIPLWLRAFQVECRDLVTRALRNTAVNPGSQAPRFITPDLAAAGDTLLMRPFQLAKNLVISPGDTLSILTDDTSAAFTGLPVAGPHFIYFDIVPITNDEQMSQIAELEAYADLEARSTGQTYESVQAVAATSTELLSGVSVPNGAYQNANPVAQIQEMWARTGAVAAAGESLVITVRRLFGGVTAILGTVTIDATVPANTQVRIPINLANNNIVEGSIIQVDRVYTAGMAPTPMTNSVVHIEVVPQQLTQQQA